MTYFESQRRCAELSTKTVMASAPAVFNNRQMKTRGDRIRFIRTEVLGLKSQAELADRLGVSRGAVGNWEKDGGIDKRYILKLARMADTSVEWIEVGKGEPPMERSPVVVAAKSVDESAVGVAVEGMLKGFGLTDSQAVELRKLLRQVLQERLSGQTQEEILNARKALAQFVTSQFLRSKGLKDGEE